MEVVKYPEVDTKLTKDKMSDEDIDTIYLYWTRLQEHIEKQINDLVVIRQPNGLLLVVQMNPCMKNQFMVKVLFKNLTPYSYKVKMNGLVSAKLGRIKKDNPMYHACHMNKDEFDEWLSQVCDGIKHYANRRLDYVLSQSVQSEMFWEVMVRAVKRDELIDCYKSFPSIQEGIR